MELENCPFCGDGGEYLDIYCKENDSCVWCETCGSHGPISLNRAMAIVNWNDRSMFTPRDASDDEE